MKISFAEACNATSLRVSSSYLELSELEKKCVEEVYQKPEDFIIEEAALSCGGPKPDGSCGLVANFPCLRHIIDDCME